MNFTFQQLKDSIQECTSFSLIQSYDEDDEEQYILLDGCGDQFGEPFYDLYDLYDFISNNDQVNDYLNQLN